MFEIGPVFRAEDSNTHRHLCEFTGLDMEMAIKEHYFEVLDVLDALFLHMFDGLNERFALRLKVVSQQYPYEPLKYLRPTLRLEFPEGIKMLQDAGVEDVDPLGDLSTAQERTLGELVKQKYDTDFYILHKCPRARGRFTPCRTRRTPITPTRSSIFIRGEEIISGAQRSTTWTCSQACRGVRDRGAHHRGVHRRVQVRRASPRRVRRRPRARRHAVPGAGEHPKDEHVPARSQASGAVSGFARGRRVDGRVADERASRELFFIVQTTKRILRSYVSSDYRCRLARWSHATPVARATSHASDTHRRNPSSSAFSIHTSHPVSVAHSPAAKSNARSRFGKRDVASGSDCAAAAATRNRRKQKTSAALLRAFFLFFSLNVSRDTEAVPPRRFPVFPLEGSVDAMSAACIAQRNANRVFVRRVDSPVYALTCSGTEKVAEARLS